MKFTLGIVSQKQIVPPVPVSWDELGSNYSFFDSPDNNTVSKSADGWTSVASVSYKTTGKWYVEFSFAASGSFLAAVGVKTPSGSLASPPDYMGTQGIAYVSSIIRYNGTEVGSGPSMSVSDTIQCAVDVDAKRIWWKQADESSWLPSGDPAAGTGGASISDMTTGMAPAAATYYNGSKVTVNGGLVAFVGSIPSGFLPWTKTQTQGRVLDISPAINGKTSWDIDVDGRLNISTPGTWTVTPAKSFVTTAKIWGAGGGDTNYSYRGGAGGAAVGDVALEKDVSYFIYVPSAGVIGSGGSPGGGIGAATTYSSGGGGGYGGIRKSNGDPILIAGGGGGGAHGAAGGAGGGSTGVDGSTYSGTPGAAGTQSIGTPYQGGNGTNSGDTSGGGGGGYVGGGGGAGGVRTSDVLGQYELIAGSYSIVVGAGGNGGSNGGSSDGTDGGNSSAFGYTATGGGGGGGYSNRNGRTGGSGGGGGTWTGAGASGTAGQGNSGAAAEGTVNGMCGGGGGASAAGSTSGTGGAGISRSITGTSLLYASGGGGGNYNGSGGPTPAARPGNGGTGGGYTSTTTAGYAGLAGTVIIRYAGPPKGTGGTITEGGGFTIHTFTSNGTLTIS